MKVNAMTCTACKKKTNELHWHAAGVWHCADCRTPPKGYSCIKKFQSTPPSTGTLKLVGFVVKLSGGPAPDYSRN